ncbi:DUF2185 domain-containing protein [Butyrivibrio sp.]|uniref:immunity protein Imm33 domain-containing protein n=1 Tax=Butyrivibrio sp. TaxID=28121 RepID=UPI0025B9F98D|nr:DUF2185 domain-containing protein [Butyrivibrio sp.]MBQ9302518.1 DUF2185 domain-containing protein [Butyrivibrio sp.]
MLTKNNFYTSQEFSLMRNIIQAYNGSFKPNLISRTELDKYILGVQDSGYVLKRKDSLENEEVIATDVSRGAFLEKTFKAITGTDHSTKDIFESDAVHNVLLYYLAPCTAYWNFMLDIYKYYESSGFDNVNTRKYIKEQVKQFRRSSNYGSLLSETLFVYTIEHFIRYAHDGLNGDLKYLETLCPIADFIAGHNVRDFTDMIASYPDMNEINGGYITEAVSDLKSFMSQIISSDLITGGDIAQDAHAHLLEKSEGMRFIQNIFPPRHYVSMQFPYTEENQEFSVELPDVLPGQDAHDKFCNLLDNLFSNTPLTYENCQYGIPARWTWNEDKTKILDTASRAAFEPLFFGPGSKEWQEADEAEKGIIFKALPQDYRHTCHFAENAIVRTAFVLSYPDISYVDLGRKAQVIITQSYSAKDGFCRCTGIIRIHDFNEKLNEKRVCWITRQVLETGGKIVVCNKDPNPEKPYDSGWMFFGENQSETYINNPENIIMVDFKTLFELFPDAGCAIAEYNSQPHHFKTVETKIDEDGDEYVHTEETWSFPMN